MKTTWLASGALLTACLALTGCGGGGNASPLPQPTATPTQALQADYFPVNNTAGFDVAMPPGSSDMSLTTAPLGVRSTYGVSCDSASGVIGDYFANAQLLLPDVEEVSLPAIGPPIFVYSNIVVTKDASNNLIVDGYVNPGMTLAPGAIHCVTPYVFMKTNAKAGDSWTYTDITGRAITATVVFDHQPKTYTAYVPSLNADAPQSYRSVTEVDYGTDFTIDWALGYGPAQIIEHNTSGPEPLSYTAFGYVVNS